MLERARPREVAVFRHVTGEEHGDALGLRETDERVGAPANLRRSPRELRAARIAQRLDRVDDEHRRTGVARGLHDLGQFATRDERDRRRVDPDPRGPRRDLVSALLPRGEEAGEPGARQVRSQLEEKGALADAGLPCEEGDGPRNDAPAEHPVETGEARRDTFRAPSVVEREGGDRNAVGATTDGGREVVDRAPATASRTPAHPLRDLLATRRADEDGPYLAHAGNLGGPADTPVRVDADGAGAQPSEEPASSTGGMSGGRLAFSKTISPSRASTMIVCPARNSFHRSFSDRGSSTMRWIVRRNGRAPSAGS